MNSVVEITPATPDEAEGIIHVQKETWLSTYPNAALGITRKDIEESVDAMGIGALERMIKRMREDIATRQWVAKRDAKVVGFIRVQKNEDKNRLHAMYIHIDHQRKGIGKMLMKEALGWIDLTRPTTLEVATYNDAAIRFYKSFGFQENGPIANAAGNLPSGKTTPEIEMVLPPCE